MFVTVLEEGKSDHGGGGGGSVVYPYMFPVELAALTPSPSLLPLLPPFLALLIMLDGATRTTRRSKRTDTSLGRSTLFLFLFAKSDEQTHLNMEDSSLSHHYYYYSMRCHTRWRLAKQMQYFFFFFLFFYLLAL